MSYESEVRRQMEIAASEQANGMNDCPLNGDVDAAFSSETGPMTKGLKANKKRLKNTQVHTAHGLRYPKMTSKVLGTSRKKGQSLGRHGL